MSRVGPQGSPWLVLARLAGASAIASAATMLAAFAAFARTAPFSEGVAITVFNVLLVPPAALLGIAPGLRPRLLALLTAAAGISAHVLWSSFYRRADMEPLWLILGTLWWLGLGLVILPSHRALGMFTLALAVIGALDAYVTVKGIGQPLLAIAGFKLLLSPVWSLWLGSALVRDPMWLILQDRSSRAATSFLGATER